MITNDVNEGLQAALNEISSNFHLLKLEVMESIIRKDAILVKVKAIPYYITNMERDVANLQKRWELYSTLDVVFMQVVKKRLLEFVKTDITEIIFLPNIVEMQSDTEKPGCFYAYFVILTGNNILKSKKQSMLEDELLKKFSSRMKEISLRQSKKSAVYLFDEHKILFFIEGLYTEIERALILFRYSGETKLTNDVFYETVISLFVEEFKLKPSMYFFNKYDIVRNRGYSFLDFTD